MATRFSAAGQKFTVTATGGSQGVYTMACWGKITNNRAAYSTWLCMDNGTGDYCSLGTNATGNTLIYGDEVNDFGLITLTVGTWYFLAAAVNAGAGTLYARAYGASTWTTAAITAASPTTNCSAFTVGDDVWGDWLDGNVMGARLWFAALTQAELDREYRQLTPVRWANIQAAWPLVKPETVDYSGMNRTLSGGTGTAQETDPGVSWQFPTSQQSPPQAVFRSANW